MIRVYCVDDHELILDGLCADLDGYEQFQVVGRSTDPRVAVDEISKRREEIDIVITDIDMPHMSGFQLCEAIKSMGDMPRVVYLTYHINEELRVRAMRTKMDGITYKSGSKSEIVAFIEDVCKGGHVVIRNLPANVPMIRESTELTATEKVVLQLLACEGLTNAEAAERLFRSKDTIETHRKNVMGKLGLKNTVEMVHYAISAGICSKGTPPTD